MRIFPFFIPMQGCPHRCIYCDQKSFDSVAEPDIPTLQRQLDDFSKAHHETPKQVAFYGGTFTGLPVAKQNEYYELVKPYLDDNTSIRISTRPDYIDDKILEWCLAHQVRTIELGIQDFSDEVLIASGRGYTSQVARNACFAVKGKGIELGVQLMPGLPQSNQSSIEYNRDCLKEIQPELLRLYPLIFIAGNPLMSMLSEGKISPLSLKNAIEICADYMEFTEQYGIQVIKCGIPSLNKGTDYIGPYHPAFGELVKAEVLIRKLETEYQPGQSIYLSEQDTLMLNGHNHISLKKLIKRLDLCTTNLILDKSLSSGKFRLSYL